MNGFFPDPAACTTGLVISRGANVSWAQNPSRRMKLFVRVQNRSGQAIQLPVRLYLPANGTTVTVPAGTPASKVLAVEPDSSEAGGGKVWFIGGMGTLAANDSTVIDTLIFNVLSPVTQAGWQFQASANSIASGGWPTQYGTFPSLDTTRIVVLPGDTTSYFRTSLVLRFGSGTSDSAKHAILSSFGATVLGVDRSGGFFIEFPDPGSSAQSFLNFLSAVESVPGVSLVVPIQRSTPYPEVFGRFPTDGSGQTRSDWLNGAMATWAMRAIRAPLAWGCENGQYGATPVRVGILEWKQDNNHPEFAASAPTLREPSDVPLITNGTKTAPTSLVDSWLAHSTGVSGPATAHGDDSAGVAGVMWRTKLFQYSGLSTGNRPANLLVGFTQFADWIAADSIQVLSISADLRLPISPSQQMQDAAIENLAVAIGHLLDEDARLLIVVAAGNDKFVGTFAVYSTVQGADAIRAALLKIRGEPLYQDRIVVVAGTQQANQFWASWYLNTSSGSNFFAGLTDIAAPAQDLVLLDRRTGATVPLTPGDRAGTSFAAPQVAGVAAQLLAMDPTLMPAQVKDYLIRGAQVPRTDSLTGASTAPSPVASAPGTLYQLDAYGALSLLSKERVGTPICGFPVSVTGNSVVLERPSGNEVIATPPSGSSYYLPLVAQGGRLISVSGSDASGTSQLSLIHLVNGTWVVDPPTTG